ncbi:hypothetical protein MUP77_08710 [Candidatus Bathyarchaeota archaeon]|nr:hypothetical protein [Candidatus Bathyarchaeota archaeon]
MSLPIKMPVVTIEITKLTLADTAPTPATSYETVMIKDLTFTKLWMEFRVTGI